ncbi:MAG: SRPBCC family protein [Myxococcota bacterium]
MSRLILVLALWTLGSTPALAESRTERVDAMRARLGTLNAEERALLAPYLRNGPVVLTEFSNRQTELPAVIYAARINAPAEVVGSVIGNPREYPKFMQALESVKIKAEHDTMTAFDWTWGVALFSMTGNNVITEFPGNEERGYRYEIRTTGGDLGIGRVSWRIYPDGPTRSVAVFSSRLDMRDANYLTRQLASEGNAVNRTINVAVATVTLLDVKNEAERRSGATIVEVQKAKPLTRPSVNMEALGPLLRRGDLVMLDFRGHTLDRVTVVGRAGSSVGRVRRVLVDPELFGQSMLHGSCAEIVERTRDRVRFSWEIPIPLLHVGGEMVLRPSLGVVAVDGISGTLSQGQWRFDTHRFPNGEAGVIGWAAFDPMDSPKLIRKLISGNDQFSHGFVAATQLAIMRSLRGRARRLPRVGAARASSRAPTAR